MAKTGGLPPDAIDEPTDAFKPRFVIHSNPATELIKLNCINFTHNENTKLYVHDSFRRTVLEIHGIENGELDISKPNSGVYSLIIMHNGEMAVEKVVVH